MNRRDFLRGLLSITAAVALPIGAALAHTRYPTPVPVEDLQSIWLVNWGEDKVHGIYPKSELAHTQRGVLNDIQIAVAQEEARVYSAEAEIGIPHDWKDA